MCNETSTTGYVVKSIALERAHFKAEVACDEANGALEHKLDVESSIKWGQKYWKVREPHPWVPQ